MADDDAAFHVSFRVPKMTSAFPALEAPPASSSQGDRTTIMRSVSLGGSNKHVPVAMRPWSRGSPDEGLEEEARLLCGVAVMAAASSSLRLRADEGRSGEERTGDEDGRAAVRAAADVEAL